MSGSLTALPITEFECGRWSVWERPQQADPEPVLSLTVHDFRRESMSECIAANLKKDLDLAVEDLEDEGVPKTAEMRKRAVRLIARISDKLAEQRIAGLDGGAYFVVSAGRGAVSIFGSTPSGQLFLRTDVYPDKYEIFRVDRTGNKLHCQIP